ncbi:hypothetical protein T08_7396 [Trichinella sp. T8]|nr:hypothetical protein T08_7396 [Trichinella sp. T8]
MLLTAILVVIVLALIYHFVTVKKKILEWKEKRVQRIPEKKTPEEIIKESKELQLKADKKQVGKTKKKTKSKKSKKAIKSTPKGTDISKDKAEIDKKIEMAESSPETIKAVAKKRSKKRTKSKKSKKTVNDTVADKAASSQMPDADITSLKITLASEDTEIDVDQPNRVPPISEETVEKPVIMDEPNVEKKDFKKIAEKAASSQMPKTDIILPKLTLANETTAIDFDQLHMVPPIADENVEKPVIKDEPKDDDRTVRFSLTDLIQMWRQTLNQDAVVEIILSKCENWFLIWIYLNSLTSLNYLNSRDEVQG